MDKSCHSVTNGNEDELFKLWCVGNTGSPLVDASMRQLWSEGWMPRRLRLLTAACLVEGLGLDWRLGRDWFESTLIDHDPAINEMMWQNAGLCGVDPWYRGVKWEEPPRNEKDEDYIQYWMSKELIWPPSLETYAIQEPPPQIIEEAESKREALRNKGVYKAAKTISNSGVRMAWPGLNNKQSIEEGEVMGVGVTPVNELSLTSASKLSKT
jgi:deoxyribodipyrimidine photolyase